MLSIKVGDIITFPYDDGNWMYECVVKVEGDMYWNFAWLNVGGMFDRLDIEQISQIETEIKEYCNGKGFINGVEIIV